MTCWGITDGSAGMVAQVQALALALGVRAEMKKADIGKPWAKLPNACYAGPLGGFIIPHLLAFGSDALPPPWPELVISCGRRGALLAMGLKQFIRKKRIESRHLKVPQQALNNTYFIHIQDPQMSPKYFDLVVAMAHDKVTGHNVLKTRFALHSITPAALEEARQRFAPRFANYPQPYVSVLIGGSTNKYTLTPESMAQVVMALQRLLGATQGSLLITSSRRTGAENTAMLRAVFANNPRVYIYDGSDENPYMGLLALAGHIIVTDDSVNMMSEAAATGKPLYILPLPGHTDTKPARFAEMLMRDGIARRLAGKLESWNYAMGDEMERLAQDIQGRMKA